jgi:ubiquinone biosynthesis protein COQ9
MTSDASKNADLKTAIVEAAFSHAVFDGFHDGLLNKIGIELDLNQDEITHLFPAGIRDIILYHSQQADKVLHKSLKDNPDFAKLRIREKIAAAVMTRLEAHVHEREAIRRASLFMAKPLHAAAGLKALGKTVNIMWHAAGDTSTDWNFYSKRVILGKIYLMTMQVWFNDESDDLEKTRDFLGRRIENVMQFEKIKAKCREKREALKDWLPDFLRA